MILAALSWLNSQRLSAVQWLCLSLAAICGLLVLMLRLQGSKLHKAQIDALVAGIKYRNVAEDANIDQLRNRLVQEVDEYEKASNSSYGE